MHRRQLAEKIYNTTELCAFKYLKELSILTALLFFSLYLQITGDISQQYLIVEEYVRSALSITFIASITITSLAHVLSYKYLQKEESI